MKTVEVEWHPKTLKNISQIPKDGVEFAFVDEKFKQSHQLVWCKDFLQDVIAAVVQKKKISIYGFSFDPEKNTISMDRTRILIANHKDENFEQRVLNCQKFLKEFEAKLGLKRTRVFKCTSSPPTYKKSGVFVLESSRRWLISPPMISLYSLFVRIGLVHNPEQTAQQTLDDVLSRKLKPYNHNGGNDNDANFLSNGKSGLDRILKEGYNLFGKNLKKNYNADTFTIHCMGLHGFSVKNNSQKFGHWFKAK